jgi:ectoine hydroxylase-related dioxygenase (phytanoyl-CoA dioxygenase family)
LPARAGTAHRVLGRPPTCGGGGGVVIPPADAAPHSGDGYLSWHRDHGAGWSGEAWPYPRERSLKVSVYLYDVPDDGGCLTFVPGSR